MVTYGGLYSQTQQVNYDVPFASGKQNMWGPSWSAFSIDTEIDLFKVPWNQSFDSGGGGIGTWAGMSFGAAIWGSFSGVIGSKFSLTGFTSGEVEVDYPIKVDITMPQDLTYDQGDVVTVQTDYTVKNGNALNSYYPSVGEAKLDLYFQFAAELTAKICVFGCAQFPVIPFFDTQLNTINIFTANINGVDFFSFNGSAPLKHYPGLPLYTEDIEDDPLGEYGLSGMLTVPYVVTSDYLSGDNLRACGDSVYVSLKLDVFGLIAGLEIPYVSAFAEFMSGSEDFMGATVWWTLLGADFEANIHNKQCFDFKPKVYGKFEFPVAVDYTVYTPTNVPKESGTSSIINVQLGNKVEYKYPCYYEELNITPTYTIDGQFTNHTYDSISFDFNLAVFHFGIDVPKITVIPEIHIPEICIRIPYPCGFISVCHKRICTPSFTIPAIIFPGLHLEYGPLWSTSIPLGSIKYDWYKNTWALQGFSAYKMSPFTMIANKLSITHTQTNIACYGGASGDVNLTYHAVSPALPYSYLWTNGANTQNISGVRAGSYQAQVVDNNGCKLFTGAILTQPEQPITMSFSKIDKLCNAGVNNGVINVATQGGTSPYTYNWNNGASTASVSNLDVGLYSVLITDNHGCTESLSVAIDEPTPLQQVGTIKHILCKNDAKGSVQVFTTGGKMPHSYSWSNGQAIPTINDLVAGTYTLTLTDANGCQNSAPYTVNEPAQSLQLTPIVTDVSCKGDLTGAINVTTTGGTAGYTYRWSNDKGIVMPNQTESITGIGDGTYTLTATDFNGCTEQFSRTVSEPTDALSSTPTFQNINCFGDATGSINPNIAGGTTGYTYTWSNGSSDPILSNVVAGSHSLNLIDAKGCTAVYNYELTQPQKALDLALTKKEVLCYGGNTGAIISQVEGGTSPYTYSWNNGFSTSNIQDVVAGSYTVTVTDDKGCVIIGTNQINEPVAPLTASSVDTKVDCFGKKTGDIVLTVLGGTTPYNYVWSNSSSLILTQAASTIIDLKSDTYNVEITDKNGCQLSYSTVVDQPAAPLNITSTITNINCYGMATGAIDASVSGGTTPYAYSWSNSAISEDITNVTSGSYTLLVTDDNHCVDSSILFINQPAEPLVATLSPNTIKCKGGSDGEIISLVKGGTVPYSYSWSNGATTASVKGVISGTYNLTVTDSKGCTSFTGTLVDEPTDSLKVLIAVNDVSCYGYRDGTVELTISGGTAPYGYNWGNQNEILLNHFSELIENLNKGRYFIRVTDRNGCQNEQYVDVNQPTPINIQAVISDAICYGDSTGNINLSVSGSTPNYSFIWDNGQTTEDAISIMAGSHKVTITDGNSCVYDTTFFVGQPNKLEAAYKIQELSCMDQADAEISVAPYGGVKPYSYNWSNGDTTSVNKELTGGTYELVIQDAHNCITTYSYIILESAERCVFIPNTITPNGDGYNDTWIIDNIELYSNASIKIFNKWGGLVYEAKGEYSPWNGEYNGNPLPSGVYYYIINLENSHSEEYTGTITIIR